MPPHFYYKADCYALNRRARLNYPWSHRLMELLQYFYPGEHKTRETAHTLQNKKLSSTILSKIGTFQQEACWEQELQTASYAVFDCETTGLQPLKGDKIISLGGVIIEKGKIVDQKTFSQLINPLRPIPPAIAALTGITSSMVTEKPTIYQAFPGFLDFLGNRVLVAHQAIFDLTFLNLELGRLAPVRIPQPVIDTFLLSRLIFPWLEGHTLENLGTCFEIEMAQRHTALGDALITARLFLKLLQQLAEKKIFTLNQLHAYLQLRKTTDAPLTTSVTPF